MGEYGGTVYVHGEGEGIVLRIALIAPSAIKIPVDGYSGIEREVQYLAGALHGKGHDVTLYCNMADGVDTARHPWMLNARNIRIENEVINYIDELKAYDVCHDWSHLKPLRLAKLDRYIATTMWTDRLGTRNVFPSRAVAAAFGRPDGAVVPLGLPVNTYPSTEDGGDYHLCFSRIADYKGTDIALRIADENKLKLVVAGHAGRFADRYYAMKIKNRCAHSGYRFIEDPDEDDIMSLMRGARGMIHMHRWVESFSLAIAQALCLGVPVLTSDRGGPQEYVTELGGGKVAKLPDDKDFARLFPAETVREFLDMPFGDGERAALASRAREYFDIDRMADTYVGIYGGLQR